MTFRTRLLLASLLTLAVGMGALVVGGNVLLEVRVEKERSSLLREQAQAQIAALDVTARGIRIRETANDAALDRRSWIFERGRLIERPAGVTGALNRAAVSLGGSTRTTEKEGPDDTQLLAVPVRARGGGTQVGTVVVARSSEAIETLEKEVLLGSAAVTLLVLLAGALALRSAIGGALRPVAQMTQRAEDWSAHDLNRRFSMGPVKDELTGLAATLDLMLDRIASLRRHEQRFASEMAHELRTPIAGLRARAELALSAEGADADAERVQALESVIAQVDRVQEAVDTLLAVARGELDHSTGSVDVAALVAEQENVEVIVPKPVPPAQGESELVRRALQPLIENAHQHARSGVTVEVTSADHTVRVEVRDDGDGLDADQLERVFEPGFRGPGASGAGLGLPLARRLALACGGDVRAEAGPGGRFVLILPVQR